MGEVGCSVLGSVCLGSNCPVLCLDDISGKSVYDILGKAVINPDGRIVRIVSISADKRDSSYMNVRWQGGGDTLGGQEGEFSTRNTAKYLDTRGSAFLAVSALYKFMAGKVSEQRKPRESARLEAAVA